MPLSSEVVFVASSIPGLFRVLNGFAHLKASLSFSFICSWLLHICLSSFQIVVDRTCLLSSSLCACGFLSLLGLHCFFFFFCEGSCFLLVSSRNKCACLVLHVYPEFLSFFFMMETWAEFVICSHEDSRQKMALSSGWHVVLCQKTQPKQFKL